MALIGTSLEKNPKLDAHLHALEAKHTASDEEVAQIQTLAGNLSVEEGARIRETLKSLEISPTARAQIDEYMLDQLEKRLAHVARQKKVGDAVSAITLGLTAVGVPVLNHFLAIAGLDSNVNLATNAVQFALLAGEYMGGYAAIRALGAHFGRSDDYGERD
ncbi:MAG: hypothetical protein U1E65_35120 [Myxococcota bacterium]